MLSTLSISLKNDITVEINGRIIENCELLVKNFSEKFLYTVALNLKEKIFSPDEIIYSEDPKEYEDHCLYFIKNGEVELYL